MKKALSILALIAAIGGAIAYDTIEFNHGMAVLTEYQQSVSD